jgi:hypothetical protein
MSAPSFPGANFYSACVCVEFLRFGRQPSCRGGCTFLHCPNFLVSMLSSDCIQLVFALSASDLAGSRRADKDVCWMSAPSFPSANHHSARLCVEFLRFGRQPSCRGGCTFLHCRTFSGSMLTSDCIQLAFALSASDLAGSRRADDDVHSFPVLLSRC